MHKPLYLFYEEPNPDRWIKFDRYPRQLVRRIVRGKLKPGGVMRWFLNLKQGLDLLGVDYRVNDYRGLRRTPNAWACVVGKPHVIGKIPPGHPILYGPGIAAHPYDNAFWGSANIKLMLISCDWFRQMYDRDLTTPVPTEIWPAGIETELWHPPSSSPTKKTILVYDKIRWERDIYEPKLIQPILKHLELEGIDVKYIRYGSYEEEDYKNLLQHVSGMVFLCEHETQGFAYLQALSSGVPVLAWDRGGYWRDPTMFPHAVKFKPVTSVPYFDFRCGEKFLDMNEFSQRLPKFLNNISVSYYKPREYVVENFDLAERANAYLDILSKISETN